MNLKILTVYSMWVYNRREYPTIRLQGKWLEDMGFKIGNKFTVEEKDGGLFLKLAAVNKD